MNAKAAFFVEDVTPSRPVYLAGYPNRRTPSEGVADPLFLRIMALEDAAGARMAMVTADLLKFPKDMAWRTKRWAEETLGLPGSSLAINLSHTHSAPALFCQECYPQWGLDVAYVRDLEATIRRGLAAALEGLEPMTVRYGRRRADFGVCRRLPDPEGSGRTVLGPNESGYRDPDHDVLTFRRPGEDGLAALWHSYACHPTARSGNEVSADWPGEMARSLGRRLGAQTVVLFAQGAGGSVMPRYRFRSEEERRDYASRWGAEADALADFALSDEMEPLALSIRSAEREYRLPYDMDRAPSEEVLMAWAGPDEPFFDDRLRPANREIVRLWACGILERRRAGVLDDAFTMATARIALGDDLQIIASSGEVTADVGRMVKDAETDRRTIFLGYCSYTDTYVPTAAMLPQGGHEALGSMCFHMRPAPFTAEIDEIILRETAATRF